MKQKVLCATNTEDIAQYENETLKAFRSLPLYIKPSTNLDKELYYRPKRPI